MNQSTQNFLRRLLHGEQGGAQDDLNRWKRQCERFTPEQMKEEHGESGHSRQWWLDVSQEKYDEIIAARKDLGL